MTDMGEDLFGGVILRLSRAFEEGDPAAPSKATEAENVRLIQESFQALGAGDIDGFTDLLHDQIVLEILGPASVPFERRLSGPRRVAEAVRSNFAALEDHRSDIQSVVAQGDTVVITGRDRGRYRQTRQPFDVHWVQTFTFRDGKIASFRQLVADSPTP
jgi:ketosteroid isomerase-like protein